MVQPPRRRRAAYLTSVYPSVSHTFIRREIGGVEARLGRVERFSVRRPTDALPDADDRDELTRTTTLLDAGPGRFAVATLRALRRPRSLAAGVRAAIGLARRSDRGALVHVAYLAEAVLLRDELARRGVEHLHVHFGTNPAAVALLAHRLGGPPWSFTVHGPDELDAPAALSLAAKAADAAFVVAISDFTAAQLRRWLPSDVAERVHVVRCAPGPEFAAAARPVDPSSRALVCVGRLAPQKGQLLLVEAFADAVDGGVDAELVLVGDGPLRAEIEEVVRRRALGRRLRVTGWASAEEVRREVLAARALVLPSFAEGLPVVLMEALALGRPVLSTFVAGIPELVQDGRSGWLVPAGDREALAKALAEVAGSPAAALDELAAAGRAQLRVRHDPDRELDRLAALLAAAP